MIEMVERHGGPMQSREIMNYKLKLMNNTQAKILMRLLPGLDTEFPHYNASYLSKCLSMNKFYIIEILDFLLQKDLVSFDGEKYYLSQDNIWKIESVLNQQSIVVLRKKIDDLNI